jgi:hypothetical protein
VSEVESTDKDITQAVLCVLVARAGGTASIRPNEFLPDNHQVRATQLPTGTLHLELVALQPATSTDAPTPSTADADALMHLGG